MDSCKQRTVSSNSSGRDNVTIKYEASGCQKCDPESCVAVTIAAAPSPRAAAAAAAITDNNNNAIVAS